MLTILRIVSLAAMMAPFAAHAQPVTAPPAASMFGGVPHRKWLGPTDQNDAAHQTERTLRAPALDPAAATRERLQAAAEAAARGAGAP